MDNRPLVRPYFRGIGGLLGGSSHLVSGEDHPHVYAMERGHLEGEQLYLGDENDHHGY